jgi:hypothetical protein
VCQRVSLSAFKKTLRPWSFAIILTRPQLHFRSRIEDLLNSSGFWARPIPSEY